MTFRDELARLAYLTDHVDLLDWVGDRDLPTLWREHDDGFWLLWTAFLIGVDRRLVVEAACDCAETALVHVPAGEDRPRLCIETARAWCRGEATLDEVLAAAGRADEVIDTVGIAVGSAAEAAVCAAAAVDPDSDELRIAPDAAANAAYAAYYAAPQDEREAARVAVLRRAADLVRARIPFEAVAAGWAAQTRGAGAAT